MTTIKLEKGSWGAYTAIIDGQALRSKGIMLNREEALLAALKHLDIKVELEQSYWIGGEQVDQTLDLTA